MKCPRCGSEIKDGRLFCEKCGEEIRIVQDFEPEMEVNMEGNISIEDEISMEENLSADDILSDDHLRKNPGQSPGGVESCKK